MTQITDTPRHCRLVGAPVQDGAGRLGCEMGPSALRTAGIHAALAGLGHRVSDLGDVTPPPPRAIVHGNAMLKALPEIAAWTEALAEAAYAASDEAMPIFLGGDHSLSAGTMAGLARRAAELRRPLFVLWLDAHPDFHTPDTTTSGNLHGVPMPTPPASRASPGPCPSCAPASIRTTSA